MTEKEGTYNTMQGCERGGVMIALMHVPSIVMCALAGFCDPSRKGDGGRVVRLACGGMRPQGGGGHDHPSEVQQKRTHTQILLSPSLLPSFFLTPVAITTLASIIVLLYLCYFQTPGGISYPAAILVVVFCCYLAVYCTLSTCFGCYGGDFSEYGRIIST